MIKLAIICIDEALLSSAKKLSEKLSLPFLDAPDESLTHCLEFSSEGLALRSFGKLAPGPIRVDFVGGAMGHRRRYGGGRKQLIGKAVGIKPKEKRTVIDATAGLGRDAFVLATLGCSVTMLEQSPIVAALLEDGLSRLDQQLKDDEKFELTLHAIDAITYLSHLNQENGPDVIYLDPMFPPLKKTAAVKKEMRVLKAILGEATDENELLKISIKTAKKRVVVKRHASSPYLANEKPDLVFEGKSARYDVYLTGPR